MTKYTIHITYALVPTGDTLIQSIHYNNIKTINVETDNLLINEINLQFPNINDFQFLNTNQLIGTGYTANRIYMLIQTGLTTSDYKPNPALWKIYDVTNQIPNYINTLSALELTTNIFKAQLNQYSGKPYYKLDYLLYPATTQTNKLCFGTETYFLGNVTTKIKADVFTSEFNIDLPLNEFNSSTNETWDVGETVYISEVGIYDSSKNLVAIGKLNNPVAKDSTIARTLVFALDF